MSQGVLAFTFNPDQPRDDHGRWTAGGGGDSPSTKATSGLADKYREGEGGRKGMGDIKMSAKDIKAMRAPGSIAAPYLDKNGNWTPERQALHDKIVQQLTAGVPSVEHPTFYMTGGGPAAGKGTAIGAGMLDTPDQYVHVDSDQIKLMLPEVQAMREAGDITWAGASHEESSYIAKRAVAAAFENSQNTLLDGTGDSSAEKLLGKLDDAKAAGYKTDAFYVSRDEEAAVAGALDRGQQTKRYVPESVIRDTFAGLRDTVPQVASHFDKFQMWDMNDYDYSTHPPVGTPHLIATGGSGQLNIHDQALWDRFENGHA